MQSAFLRVHNETLSVVAMCVNNPDRSPFGIHGLDPAPTPTGFLEIVAMISKYVTRRILLDSDKLIEQ